MKILSHPAGRLSAAWAFFGILVLGPGCMRHEVDFNEDFSTGIQQNDIPVPLNFQFDKDHSHAYIKYTNTSVGSFRSWTGYYYGDQQVGNLASWYRMQMPVDGWTYKDTRDEMDRKCLRFLKGDETASIWLYREFDHRFDRFTTMVKAEIHPTPVEEMGHEEALSTTASASPREAVRQAAPPAPRAIPVRSLRAGSPAPAQPGRGSAGGKGQRTSTALVPEPSREEAMEEDETAGPGAALERTAAGSRGTAGLPAAKDPAPAARAAARANKPVVTEEPGAENNEESQPGDEFTPDDGK